MADELDTPTIRLRLYRMARCCGLSREDAEDVVQDALIKAHQQKAAIRDSPSGWLYTCTTNLVRDALRRQSRTPCDPIDYLDLFESPDPTPLDALLRADRRRLVNLAVATLSVNHQTVLRLRYWYGVPTVQIAVQLGVSEGTVKSRLNRARKQLRRKLAGM